MQSTLANVLDLGGEIVAAVGIGTTTTLIAGLGGDVPILSGSADDDEWPDMHDGLVLSDPRMSRHLEMVRFVDHHPANDALEE